MTSRRAFLIGVGASVAALAVPVMPKAAPFIRLAGPPMPFAPLVNYVARPVLKPNEFFYLHPAQWEHFKAGGFDMRRCKLVGQIPRTA